MDKIAVLIPCYNEEKTIAKVVKDAREALPEAVYVFKSPDMDKFAGGNFNLTFFGDYSVAVPVTEPESSP